MRSRALWLGFLLLVGCRDLAPDFDRLSLDEQIKDYEGHFAFFAPWSPFTSGLNQARSGISWHGLPAAESMLPYLTSKDPELSHREALTIIGWVQNRGCSLRGTAVHRAVLAFLDSPYASEDDKRFARTSVLRSIEEDRLVDPEVIWGKKGGPCEQEAVERAAREGKSKE